MSANFIFNPVAEDSNNEIENRDGNAHQKELTVRNDLDLLCSFSYFVYLLSKTYRHMYYLK
jgi:hypothetical protein